MFAPLLEGPFSLKNEHWENMTKKQHKNEFWRICCEKLPKSDPPKGGGGFTKSLFRTFERSKGPRGPPEPPSLPKPSKSDPESQKTSKMSQKGAQITKKRAQIQQNFTRIQSIRVKVFAAESPKRNCVSFP